METEGKKRGKTKISKDIHKDIYARDRIRPRGLWGWMEGKIHYDEKADIFNLNL
jgi:hypothetical protein